jgi:hypothetical protein
MVSLSYITNSSFFLFLTILKNEHVPPKNHQLFILGKFLADNLKLIYFFSFTSCFSDLTIIFPDFFILLLIKSLIKPCYGDPNIYPTLVSIFPTSVGGFAS